MAVARLAWLRVLPIAAAQGVLLVATGNAYGYHRDELYFRLAGRHLQWGYPDQPPLTPLLGRVSEAFFGETPRGLRVVSAVLMAVCVLLAAAIARELGGGPTAQMLAALAYASSGFALAVGHLLSTTTTDAFFWTVLAWLLVRLLRTDERRLWLALGLVTGVALLNKHLVLLFWLCALPALVLGGRRELLRTAWLPAAALLAALLWVPNLVWQARHGWPQLELADQIANEDPTGNRAFLLPFQLLTGGVVTIVLAVAGLRLLARDARLRRFRPLAFAYPLLLALALLGGLKPYYTLGLLAVLAGVAGLHAERWLPGARRSLVALAAGGALVWFAVTLPIALPIVPVGDVGSSPVGAVNEDALETIGWPAFVRQVAAVAKGRDVVVLAGNYGEAGAIDRYGPALGLPHAYSGQNGLADWGIPPASAGPVIVLDFPRAAADRFFTGCRPAARVDNGVGVDNEEQGGEIFLCGRPRAPWRDLWPRLTHLSA